MSYQKLCSQTTIPSVPHSGIITGNNLDYGCVASEAMPIKRLNLSTEGKKTQGCAGCRNKVLCTSDDHSAFLKWTGLIKIFRAM